MLTTTQHSALVELRRYGALRPSRNSFDPVTGRRAFSSRTLDALASGGYAKWDGNVLVPLAHYAPLQFTTSYMDTALYNLPEVIEKAKAELAGVDFDTIVGTGFSGGVVIPALALAMGKQFVLIRKETDDSHHGKGRLLGSLGMKWIFVDDFVSSGKTRTRVLAKVEDAIRARENAHVATYVGDYMYTSDKGFQPAHAAYTGYNA